MFIFSVIRCYITSGSKEGKKIIKSQLRYTFPGHSTFRQRDFRGGEGPHARLKGKETRRGQVSEAVAWEQLYISQFTTISHWFAVLLTPSKKAVCFTGRRRNVTQLHHNLISPWLVTSGPLRPFGISCRLSLLAKEKEASFFFFCCLAVVVVGGVP